MLRLAVSTTANLIAPAQGNEAVTAVWAEGEVVGVGKRLGCVALSWSGHSMSLKTFDKGLCEGVMRVLDGEFRFAKMARWVSWGVNSSASRSWAGRMLLTIIGLTKRVHPY